jgi:dimethylargininase
MARARALGSHSARNIGMRHRSAIVRPPAATFAAGLTSSPQVVPNLALALEQHAAYCRALSDCGLALAALPPDAEHPDSCFVEDPAIVTERGALVTRPGAASRLGESDSIFLALQNRYREVARMSAPGTLDGGDVCQADDHFLIGLSARTNEEGARQLAGFLERLGYRSSIVDIRGSDRLLHLKSGLSYLGENRIVVAPELSELDALSRYEPVVVADAEFYAANCLSINHRVLVAAGYPGLASALLGLGYDILPLDLSEFRKMDGSLTCLSLRI